MSEVRQLQQRTWFTHYWPLPKMWKVRFLYVAYSQGKDFELILTVKMETRHPIEGYFVSEFQRSVIIAELWWPEVARPGNFLSNFCAFFGKKDLLH